VAPSAESPLASSSTDDATAPLPSAPEDASPDAEATDPTTSLESLLPAVDTGRRRVLALVGRQMGGRGVDGLAMLVMDVDGDREVEEYTLHGPAPGGVRVHDGGVFAALALIHRGAGCTSLRRP
jgi:hypothetical protein